MITLYLGSAVPGRPLAILAIGASLIRIACSVVTLRHAILMRHRSTLGAPEAPDAGRHDARR